MDSDIDLQCRCGKVRGRLLAVSPVTTQRVLCYCKDCQAFARFLGSEGVIDPYGASEIVQTTPARLRIDAGSEQLACVRLLPTGMLRWYTACCRTPVANTSDRQRVPFAGVVGPFIGAAGRDAAGPPRMYLHTRSALNGPPPGVDPKLRPSAILNLLKVLVLGAMRGEHAPSPFRDAAGKLRVTPEVLAPEQLAALREARAVAVAAAS